MGVPPRDAQNAKCVGLYTFCSRLDTTEAFRRHIVTMVVRENKVSVIQLVEAHCVNIGWFRAILALVFSHQIPIVYTCNGL